MGEVVAACGFGAVCAVAILISVGTVAMYRKRQMRSSPAPALRTTAGGGLPMSTLELARYKEVLTEIGRLTYWAGWLEQQQDHSQKSAGANLRKIQEICSRETGLQFLDFAAKIAGSDYSRPGE